MESKNTQYRKALEEIRSLCYFHVGDKHDFMEEVMRISSEALKRRQSKKPPN